MSSATRPKATRMTVCDLCDEEILDGQPDETGSLTNGYIAHPVNMPKTRHVWLMWPPGGRKRKASYEDKRRDPEQFRERRYDFHAECILRLVEAAIATHPEHPATEEPR